MLRTLPESEAVSGLHVERRLVGNWTLDLKPSVERNVVRIGSGAVHGRRAEGYRHLL
jgi:hypothetical protein